MCFHLCTLWPSTVIRCWCIREMIVYIILWRYINRKNRLTFRCCMMRSKESNDYYFLFRRYSRIQGFSLMMTLTIIPKNYVRLRALFFCSTRFLHYLNCLLSLWNQVKYLILLTLPTWNKRCPLSISSNQSYALSLRKIMSTPKT